MDNTNTMFINKLLLFSFLLLISCGKSKIQSTNTAEETNMQEKKFEWRPSECAPIHYASQIYHGSIITEDDKYYTIPNGRTINNGWGTFGTLWDVGDVLKPVPNSLKVIWWSFTENQFYFLETKLPKEKMTELFEKGFVNYRGKQDNFNEILVGLAPGGIVSVWLLSSSYVVEVGHYQAKKTEVEMKDFVPDGEQDKTTYLKNRAESYSEETKQILTTQDIPFGKWTRFRKRFLWKPVIKHTENFKLDRLYCDFYNGEKYVISDKNQNLITSHNYPPANKITFYWYDKNNNKFGCKISFDEKEIWDVFKKSFIKPNENPIELVIAIDKYNGSLIITLETENETIEIKKAKINIFESN